MKSKRLFLAFVTIAFIVLSGCEKDDNVTLVSITVTSQPTKKTYLVDETFDPAGMIVTATYSDKSTTLVTINADNLTYDFSTAGTNKIVTITVTYEDKTATATVTGITVNPIPELVVTVLGEYTYNGAPIEPSGENVTIKYGDITLTENDYTLSYSSNINAGMASITATGRGNYARSVGMANFTINPIVAIFSVTVTGIYIYNGMPIMPSGENVTIKYDDITLNENDYTLSYYSNLFDGTATVMVTGTGNYAGSSGTAFFTILPFAGSGTNANPYEISSLAQLARLATLVNTGNVDYNDKYYELTCDIDLSNSAEWNNGKGWIPIGSAFNAFSGHFDGKKHKVSNLYINDNTLTHAGLFGLILGTVRNLGVDCDITGGSFVGGVVGNTFGSVTNCYSTGVIRGNYYVGGIAGYLNYNNSSVVNCYTTAEVSGSGYYVGGLVGVVYGGSIINCYATGTVICNNYYVGGLAGTVENGGSLKNCVALNPSISCQNFYLGRIAGQDGTLSNNVAWDSMLINGSTVISDSGSSLNGADITKTTIAADGSIGGRFTINDGWTIENGKLPGFDTAVALPEHLK